MKCFVDPMSVPSYRALAILVLAFFALFGPGAAVAGDLEIVLSHSGLNDDELPIGSHLDVTLVDTPFRRNHGLGG